MRIKRYILPIHLNPIETSYKNKVICLIEVKGTFFGFVRGIDKSYLLTKWRIIIYVHV